MARKIDIIKGILKRSDKYSLEYLLTWAKKDLISYRQKLLYIEKQKKEEENERTKKI